MGGGVEEWGAGRRQGGGWVGRVAAAREVGGNTMFDLGIEGGVLLAV